RAATSGPVDTPGPCHPRHAAHTSRGRYAPETPRSRRLAEFRNGGVVPRTPASSCVAPYITPKVSRIVHRIAVRIVVEVGKDVQSVIQVLLNLPGLGGEGLACVAPAIVDPM